MLITLAFLLAGVIAEEGDQVRIVAGRTYRNDVPMDDPFVAAEFRSRENWGPLVVPEAITS